MVWVMNMKMVSGVVSEAMGAMMDTMTTMDLAILGEDLEVMGTTTTLVQGNVFKNRVIVRVLKGRVHEISIVGYFPIRLSTFFTLFQQFFNGVH